MEREIVRDLDKWLVICNEELRKYPDFQEGMKITGTPDKCFGPTFSGYSWKGPSGMRPIVSAVMKKVKENYKLVLKTKKKK